MASYIKTLKEDNGDITYPQTLASAVFIGNSDVETEMGKFVMAEDIASTSALTPPVTTNMIADEAVTEAKIDSTFIDKLFYKPGDNISMSVTPGTGHAAALSLAGGLTTGNADFYVSIPVSKKLDLVNGVTINSMTGYARCHGAYLTNMNTNQDVVAQSTAVYTRVNKDTNRIEALFNRSSGWGATNNAAVSFQVLSYSITFN